MTCSEGQGFWGGMTELELEVMFVVLEISVKHLLPWVEGALITLKRCLVIFIDVTLLLRVVHHLSFNLKFRLL